MSRRVRDVHRPSVLFVDSVGESVSLGLVRDRMLAGLERSITTARVSSADSLARRQFSGLRHSKAPVVVMFVAHYLGFAAYRVPSLLNDRIRIYFLGWEIEQLTMRLTEELRGADVILTISDFNTDVFRRWCPDTPVLTVRTCPELPPTRTPDRERFGLPPRKLLVVSVFDPVSGLDRKNPIDVITAFQMAFPGRSDVGLVFKTHGDFGGQTDGERQRATDFLRMCAEDPRILHINEKWPHEDVLDLVASCDVAITLARAEGLGLPVLEAMALSVPTVCPAYSGLLDFVTAQSNLLVPVTMVSIGEDASHYYHPAEYQHPPRWGQPNLAVAAAHLRALADDAGLRKRIGEAGLQRAAQYQRACATSRWHDELRDLLRSQHLRDAHPRRQEAFLEVVTPDITSWRAHVRNVRHARFSLAARTTLGRWKRRVLHRANWGQRP